MPFGLSGAQNTRLPRHGFSSTSAMSSGGKIFHGGGKYYFEAVSLVSRLDVEYLNNPGNMLCLSAESAAKFMHASFEWLDDMETKVQQFWAERAGGSLQDRQMRIRLAGPEATITWTEQHFMRLISLWKCAD